MDIFKSLGITVGQPILANSLEDLWKAGTGEGSRGGKITGHTASGKPIYGGNHSMADHKHLASKVGYGNKDHEDAADHLSMQLARHDDKAHMEHEAKHPDMTTSDRQGSEHSEASSKTRDKLVKLITHHRSESKKGIAPGTSKPGNSVIGRTKSGANVHSEGFSAGASHNGEAAHSARLGYDKKDHADAAKIHDNLAEHLKKESPHEEERIAHHSGQAAKHRTYSKTLA